MFLLYAKGMDTTMLATLFLTVSQTLALPPGLLSSVCYVESGHRAQAINPTDGGSASIGACQIKSSTARAMGFRGSDKLLSNPQINVYYAGLYLKHQLNRYNGDIAKSLAAYNSGTLHLNNKGQIRNCRYVKRVLTAWESGR